MDQKDIEAQLDLARNQLAGIHRDGHKAYSALSADVSMIAGEILDRLEKSVGETMEPETELDKERFRIAKNLVDALDKALKMLEDKNGDS